MNTIQKGLFIAILTVVFLANSANAQTFTTDLRYGSIGADVSALQEFLVDQGYLNYQATGNFYSLTLSAVKRFQTAQGITPVSGYVGPITRGVINRILDEVAPVSEGNATTTLATPVINAPVFGAMATVTPEVIPPVSTPIPQVQIPQNNAIIPPMEKDLSELVVRKNKLPTQEDTSISFYLELRDKDGKTVEKPNIQIEVLFNGLPYTDIKKVRDSSAQIKEVSLGSINTATDGYPFGRNKTNEGVWGVQYNPTLQKGVYEFTFTAGGLTKTEKVIVE